MKQQNSILALVFVALLVGGAAIGQWSTNYASSAALRPEVIRESRLIAFTAPDSYQNAISMTNSGNVFAGTWSGSGLTTNFYSTNVFKLLFTNGVLQSITL